MSESDEIEVRLLTSSQDLDDYEILSIRTMSVAVPYQTTGSFRKIIWAAMVTYAFGNQSVDYVLRRYGGLWERKKKQSVERDPRVLLLRESSEMIKEISNRLAQYTPSDRLGDICSKASLCRLEATFKAAHGLIIKGYIFETDALIRMLLEQIAWAYVAYSASDSDIPNLLPTRCITPFKKIFPESGLLYGQLSEWAHIDPSIVENYLRFHQSNIPVVRRSRHNSLQSGIHLLALASVYVEVVQLLFSVFTPEEYAALDTGLRNHYRKYCKLVDSGSG